jgi:nitrogen regulatory protein PII
MDNMKPTPVKRIKLLVAIVDRGKGDDVVEILRESGVTYNLVSPAYRATGLEIMDYLGLANPERDIIFSVVTEDKVGRVLNKLLYKLNFDEPGNGLAFTIPISGVSGPLALRYISGIIV